MPLAVATYVTGSTSQRIVFAPTRSTTLAVAGNVNAGTITPSPGARSIARAARWRAAVPEDTTAQAPCPVNSARASSKRATYFP